MHFCNEGSDDGTKYVLLVLSVILLSVFYFVCLEHFNIV